MKRRDGFVSNSSSSSFIIALKNNNGGLSKDIEEKLLEWAKNELIEKSTMVSTIEGLDNYLLKTYYGDSGTIDELLEEYPSLRKHYEESIKLINEGYSIVLRKISNNHNDEHLDMYLDAFNTLATSDDFKGIKTDLSY
jgi:hypothetical protein